MCGTFEGAIAAGALTAWAQCWFLALVFVVLVTIAVLFILAVMDILTLHRKV